MAVLTTLSILLVTGVVFVGERTFAAEAPQGVSLCVIAEQGCFAHGEASVRIEIGKSEATLVGGQFSVQYDPAALELIRISPGATCDPTSPFVLEIFETVDHENGEIFYAVGVQPIFYAIGLNGDGTIHGSQGPVTLACLDFALADSAPTQVCLFNDESPFSTKLVNDSGHLVSIDNSQACPPEPGPPMLSCDIVEADTDCVCLPDTDCSELNNDCRVGVCDEDSGECVPVPINEGGPCDDGNQCTTLDVCVEGECVGFGCRNPSLCVVAADDCFYPGDVVQVAIWLGEGSSLIAGGQFSIQYDAAAFELIDMGPGRSCDPTSPFVMELFETVDELDGEIFYAVGVHFLQGVGTREPAALACLTFLLLGPSADGICLFNDLNPFSTILVTQFGQAASIHNGQDCPTDRPLPVMSCDNICVRIIPPIIPSLGGWGLVNMTLLLLTVAKIHSRNRNRRT